MTGTAEEIPVGRIIYVDDGVEDVAIWRAPTIKR